MPDLDTLLLRTSRTFALAIPELPEPTRREVGIAYLLFRIADTFEDATLWPAPKKTDALATFERLLDPDRAADAEAHAARWSGDPPLQHDGYVELLGETPAVLEALGALRPEAQAIIRRHVVRTTRGMMPYAAQGAALGLDSLQALRDYCYVVAGIVGEMLTELFLLERPALEDAAPALRERAASFAEGLQLTNVLRDAEDDVEEGRAFLPFHVDRAAVTALARENLVRAEAYVDVLRAHRAPRGIIAFTALPVQLAWATLDRVDRDGPGAKLTREEVAAIVGSVYRALDSGGPVSRTS